MSLALREGDRPRFRTKAELVYEEFREALVTGRLIPGERIDQDALARDYGVSNMPIRQALVRLESQRLVESRPHHGVLVASMSAADMEEIYAMRSVLEQLVAERAAERITESTLDALEALLVLQESAVAAGDFGRYVQLDRMFHRDLYASSDMRRCCDTIEFLRDASDRYVYAYAAHRGKSNTSIEEHRRIVAAARAGEATVLGELCREHVIGASALLLHVINAYGYAPVR